MLQAYQGYFQENVRFIADNVIVKIPPNKRIIINILDEITDEETVREEEIAKRREMVKSLKGCLAGYEIDLAQIKEERVAKRGLLT
jgi:hypothetical protein